MRGRALLIHGFGGSSFSWRLIAPALSEMGYYTVAVDLPGFGYSSREHAVEMNDRRWTEMMWELADRLEARADEEGFSRGGAGSRWLLLGHSLGGRIVATMGSQWPERAERVVFVDAALYGPPAAMPLLGLAPLRWLVGRWVESQLLTERGVRRMLESAYGRRPTDEEVRGYLVPLLRPGTVPVLIRIGRAMPEVAAADLERITCPALIIWGQRDSWIDVKNALRVFNDLPEGEIFIVPDAGHLPIETHPGEVIRRLGEFLHTG